MRRVDAAGMSRAMEGARATHARLMRSLATLDDAQVPEPSRLPGWSRGHVLTHIARNADSHVRVLEGAARGEVIEQYAGGKRGRAAAIEDGARRSLAELVDDVDASARRLFDLWGRIPERVWSEGRVALQGGKPAWTVPFSRWRETEVHHVDLDVGYEIDDWPLDFVEPALHEAAAGIEGRLPAGSGVEVEADDLDFGVRAGESPASHRVTAPARVVLAWLTGRLPPDDPRATALPSLSEWM